ncbi:hypothetical protein [Bradyrhizobium sp. BRP23]|uniref:hypothetical protein n=1 Tax=Bradyrhizobium sp. BRP23 TaxID=2793820 RepID=UPI001CD2FE98|nr:hypothetical protein [Bradyrhizobium sp. BRP23]MCA1419462.1 hypothetical protein [Bradyrhizobium sp. BRP23]
MGTLHRHPSDVGLADTLRRFKNGEPLFNVSASDWGKVSYIERPEPKGMAIAESAHDLAVNGQSWRQIVDGIERWAMLLIARRCHVCLLHALRRRVEGVAFCGVAPFAVLCGAVVKRGTTSS